MGMCNLVDVAMKNEYVRIKLMFYYLALWTYILVIRLCISLLSVWIFVYSLWLMIFQIIICFETSRIMLPNAAANTRTANRKSFSYHLTCFPERSPACECCNKILTPSCCFRLVIRGFLLLYAASKWAWAALCAELLPVLVRKANIVFLFHFHYSL